MIKLNPAQQQAIECIDRPCLVLAGAGSGKTRVITQKILHLLDNGYRAAHIAAITFTNKAAHEMQERLKGMIEDKKTLNQLTISTFHALGLMILKQEAAHLGYKQKFSIFGTDDALSTLKQMTGIEDKAILRNMQSQISDWKNKRLYTQKMIEASEYYQQQIAKINYSNSDNSNSSNPNKSNPNKSDQSNNKTTENLLKNLQQSLNIFDTYQQTLKIYQAMDFDDLILQTYLLFEQKPEVLEKWQHRLRYILVDEYQDTNYLQYELLKKLVVKNNGSLAPACFTLVGDDDQSIYAWRGADVENLKKVVDDFPLLNVVKLEQNYRSCNKILEAANQIIAHNPRVFDKKLWSNNGEGEAIQVYSMHDEDHEAQGTIFRISAHQHEYKTHWHEYAILYRNNYQARLFEQILRQENIPYSISGGQSFFDKTEIKDICAYLRLMVNLDDDLAFIRALTTPNRGIAMQTLNTIADFATRNSVSLFQAAQMHSLKDQLTPQIRYSLEDFCQHIQTFSYKAEREDVHTCLDELMAWMYYEPYLYEQFDERQAQNKWQTVLEFLEWLKKRGTQPEHKNNKNNIENSAENYFDDMAYLEKQDDLNDEAAIEGYQRQKRTLAELVQGIQLMNILERKSSDEQKGVQLSTLHAAKGLEFNYVYLIGLEENILPYAQEERLSPIEEERRLMYVGVTRARLELHLSWCKQRKKGGEKHSTEASRFLQEMGLLAERSLSLDEKKAEAAYYLAKMRAILKR